MGSPTPVGMAEGLVDADGTVYKPKLLGPWQLLYGRTNFMTSMELRGVSSSLLYNQVQLRVAVDPNDPEDWDATLVGTGQNADGVYAQAFDMSGAGYDGYTWVQAAVFTKISSGSTLNCMARLWSSVEKSGWIVARQRLVVEGGASGRIIPIGNPFSAAGVSGLMWNVTYSGLDGTNGVTPTWGYRTFDGGDTSRTNDWSWGSAETEVVANSRKAYKMATTTTAKLLVQPGLKYSADAATGGTLDIIVAAKI